MPHALEPPDGLNANWDELYLARGSEEVAAHRPVFTGDIFESVTVQLPRGDAKTKSVMVVQHPCAMRGDGVGLAESLLVAEVRRFPVLPPDRWGTSGRLMPLPVLLADVTSSRANQAALFDNTYHVHPEDLEQRIACLSLRGVNLLLQRWVYHSSRVVVPSWNFNEVVGPVYEEAEIVEEWAAEAVAAGRSASKGWRDANSWLDVAEGDRTRRKMLEDPQKRSGVRRQARAASKAYRTVSGEDANRPEAA